MPHTEFVLDLATIVVAALVAGALAHRLRMPSLVGYLVAGAAIGPHALRLVGQVELVLLLAEVGVAFLMFTIGVHVSLAQLERVRNVAVVGGAIQILLTMLLGMVAAFALGLDGVTAVFLGAVIALSSTSVVLKVLADRGELDSLYGRITTGILIVQDLSVVPMVVLLSALAGPTDSLLEEIVLAVAKAAAVLAGMYLLGTRVIPRVLYVVAETRSRELFLLTIVALVLGTALGAAALGLSLAFGAFIAGVVVSESEFSSAIFGEVVPLRDLFAMLFFVSVGMLVDFAFIAQNPGTVATVIAVILFGKVLVSVLAVAPFGYAFRPVILTGLALGQIGEFSFVLAAIGVSRGIISETFSALTVAAALVTMILTPAMIQSGPRIVQVLQGAPLLRRIGLEPAAVFESKAGAPLSGHVVIAGFGHVGQTLAQVLEARNFRYFVIDYDPNVVARLRERGVPSVYGDASNPLVLELANLPRARVFAVTLPDPFEAERAIRNAMRINPRLDVIARAVSHRDTIVLRDSGADEVVEPKFEAGLEIVRHTLHRFGVSGTEAAYQISRLRQRHYSTDRVEQERPG